MEKMKTCSFLMKREGRKNVLLSQRVVVGKGQGQTTQFSRRGFALDSFPHPCSPVSQGVQSVVAGGDAHQEQHESFKVLSSLMGNLLMKC